MQLAGGWVVTPDGVLDPGWVSIDGATLTAVGSGTPSWASIDLEGRWVLPGFVDLHVHGGGGHSVTAGDLTETTAAVAFHRRHGTTRTLLSLVTAPADELLASTARLSEVGEAGLPTVAGIHLEGPFLSTDQCGAQDPRFMVDPDPALLEALLEAGRGAVRVVTLAPERPGALALVAQLVGAGVVAAIGHTDASYDEAAAAIAAGARLATHLGNAMRPLHQREPGAVAAALVDPGVVCELIVDGVHLHPGMVRLAVAAKGVDGIALITDAINATGAGDGRYRLGHLEVDVSGGVARLVVGGSLAGSTLTMDAAVRNAVALDIPLPVASRAASLVPARVLGLADTIGSIEAGKDADLVVLDDQLEVEAVVSRGIVVRGGEWLDPDGA